MVPTGARSQARAWAAWVAELLLADPGVVAARLLPPAPAGTGAPQAGRRDVLHRLELETAAGRRFWVSVVTDEPIPADSLSKVPAWAFPGPFGDALADPEPREWVALVSGGDEPFAVAFVRDYIVRRLVMARHLESGRNGVVVALADDEVILDLALDLQRVPAAFAALPALLTEVDAAAIRPTEPGEASRQ